MKRKAVDKTEEAYRVVKEEVRQQPPPASWLSLLCLPHMQGRAHTVPGGHPAPKPEVTFHTV